MIILLFFSVEQYIETRRDKNTVVPDPNGLYTKRKQYRSLSESSKDASQLQGDKTPSSVDYPTEGWNNSLSRLPVFTRAEMNEHIARTGKTIDIQCPGHDGGRTVAVCALSIFVSSGFVLSFLRYHVYRVSNPTAAILVAFNGDRYYVPGHDGGWTDGGRLVIWFFCLEMLVSTLGLLMD